VPIEILWKSELCPIKSTLWFHKAGHCDLVQEWVGGSHGWCLHTRYQPSIYHSLDMTDPFISKLTYCNGKHYVILWPRLRSQWPMTHTYWNNFSIYVNKMCIKITPPASRVRFVGFLNFHHVKIEMAAVTLGNGSRSNGWYGSKFIIRKIIWHIEKILL